MGLVDILLQVWKGEKSDQNLEVFFNSVGISRVPLNKEYKGAQLTNPSIVDIPTPGNYGIFFGPEDSPLWVKLHFNKKGPHIIEPVIIRKEHVKEIFGIPHTSLEEYRSLRILRLGSKQSYEHARDLAVKLERFEDAAQFRDKIKNAQEDKAPAESARIEEAKKPWLSKKLLLASPILAGLSLAAIVALAGKLYFDSKDNSKKLDQILERVPRKDYVPNMSPTEIKYAQQFGLASELDIILRAEIAKNPKITGAEAGFLYLHPVHDEKEGKYNMHVNSKELRLSILIKEHTGEIDATETEKLLIKEFGLDEIYQKAKDRVWKNIDYKIAAEIKRDQALTQEAKPWEERLSKEYGMPVKVTIEYVKPMPNYPSGEIAGTEIMKMKLDNIILNYTKTTFYVKTGEEPAFKLPMYKQSPLAKPMESLRGTLNIDDKLMVHFDEDEMYAVSTGPGRHEYLEHNDDPKPEEHKEPLRQGIRAYNDFRNKYDIGKFMRTAKEWADK